MANPSSFQDRLQHMEATRNQRLSLLQSEKELQGKKSALLASKLSNLRSGEQRCLIADRKVATQNLKVSLLKSEIVSLEAKYRSCSQQLRILTSEVEELAESEKEKKRIYNLNRAEMDEFRVRADSFILARRANVRELEKRECELKSNLQGNRGNLSDSSIAEAEKKGSELLVEKENLDRSLASNHRIRSQLQKQLQNALVSQKLDSGNVTRNRVDST